MLATFHEQHTTVPTLISLLPDSGANTSVMLVSWQTQSTEEPLITQLYGQSPVFSFPWVHPRVGMVPSVRRGSGAGTLEVHRWRAETKAHICLPVPINGKLQIISLPASGRHLSFCHTEPCWCLQKLAKIFKCGCCDT